MHSSGYILGDFVKTLKLVLFTMEIHVNFFNPRARVSLNLSRVKCFETFPVAKLNPPTLQFNVSKQFVRVYPSTFVMD